MTGWVAVTAPEATEPARSSLLTAALTATGILANALLLPILPDLVDRFGQDEAGGGLLLAVGSAPGIVLAPLLGTIADRLGRRAVAVPSLLVFAIGGIAMALAPTWSMLLVARILQGVGATALVSLAVVLIGDWYSGSERTRQLARNAAVLTSAGALAPLVSGLIGSRIGPQAPLWLGALALPIALLAARSLPSGPETHPAPVAGAPTARVIGHGLVLPLLLGAAMFVVYFGPARAGATFALAQRFDASTDLRGVVLLAASVPSAVVALALSRRAPESRTRWVIAGFVLFSLGLAGMAASPTVVTFALAGLLTGAAEGLIVPLLQSQVSESAPAEHRAAVLATWASGVRIGQTSGPLIAGAVLRAWSPAVLFTGAAAVTAVLAAATTRLPRRHSPSTT